MSSQPYDPRLNIKRSGYTSRGFADRYDIYRPTPPTTLLDVLTQLAQTKRPSLVVDLGSGTGLSTAVWADRAQRVIGIEPNADMRRRAEERNQAPNVLFHDGFAHQTGVPAGTADIVTCAQSFHWMEPESTFTEVARILRPGGVFAAYDYDWPPTMHWEVETAFLACIGQVHEQERQHQVEDNMQQWAKTEHLARLRASGQFRYAREILLHSTGMGTAEGLVGFARTLGHVTRMLDLGFSDATLGLDDLRQVAERTIDDGGVPWYFSYRIRVGVK
ncbi:MAG: class I SAM-dependent methyltransferase [Deltaproteobacteria bacterium]|nr:class I SAM-dependent methyltransferase [Deltaproteobacteria bacterium]